MPSRCDVIVSSNGVVEKLASGFLKPFLTHLQAVEDQVSGGCKSVRLEYCNVVKDAHGKSWFTKGTLERSLLLLILDWVHVFGVFEFFVIMHCKRWVSDTNLNRFVRFVSTPEILESVKSIDDEMTLLRQAWATQVKNYAQVQLGLGQIFLILHLCVYLHLYIYLNTLDIYESICIFFRERVLLCLATLPFQGNVRSCLLQRRLSLHE
jgi:hypothetical protein